MRKSEGKPTGMIVHPQLRGSARAAIFRDLGVFLAMANKCLELGYFPRPGRLPVLGKTVERMLVGRLQWHLMPKLQATQYGFMPQRGTEDALYDLMTYIYKELNLKKIVLMVSLDIEGAFDNAWWPALKAQLLAYNCPVNLYGMVKGYLRDREVIVRYAGGESRRGTSKGCIQGSIAGPTFWNLILDSLLRELGELGVYVQAFADDVVLMFSGQSASSIEEEAITLSSRTAGERRGSESGGREDHIHYRNRANRAVRIVRLGTGDRKLGVRKMLDAVQRSVALKACRAHRSVPAFCADPSRLLPLDIRVREAAWLYEIGYESVENLDSQTVDRLAVVGPQIYTDGSRIEGKVGAALTEWRDGEETWCSTLRLDPFCTVFQAEMVALQRAIRRVKNGREGLVNIFSDSKSSLEVLTGLKTYHPLAQEARRDISEIVAEGRAVRLFWVRAHAGIAGNERADELARRAALTKKTAADYDRFPLSYAKKVIRAASLEEWQQRYAEGTGDITKASFPSGKAYRVLGDTEMTSHMRRHLQVMVGSRSTCLGLSCGTHPLRLRPLKFRMLHVLEDCDMFFRERHEAKLCRGLEAALPEILDDARKEKFLNIVQL
ncbi:Putative 115 kDa protein in type-1 retrotransposable element R1DM [Eumeta japonica]|uniref:115 kDa protein in type-1 retrotransposable element R1DM n=1 Tax=Eumeta variegata TaxID=151549 RepID=A0A4C1ZBJ2_EUMVA|nr:Putative 115 kDa protein in type-1 retrotransposable element R1DM [Eumeta japonica]